MADIVLGSSPKSMSINLVKDADFVTGIDSQDGNWPSSCVIALRFNDPAHTVWPATINAAAADWNVDKATVATLVASLGKGARVELTYADGTTDLVWFRGRVVLVGF